MYEGRKGFTLRILSFGELLWDVFGEGEFLGGAPLNFSASAQRLGNTVALVSGVGADARGTLALQAMEALGLTTRFVQIAAGHDTGTAMVNIDQFGNATFVIKRPAAFDGVELSDSLLSEIEEFHPGWIYFGTLTQANLSGEQKLQRCIAGIPEAKCFYDMNLREGHWDLALVQRLSRLASIIKLNEAEAETLFRLTCGAGQFSLEQFCRYWSSTYGGEVICVTLGSRGCGVWENNVFRIFEGYSVLVVDTVGAGDAFAAAFLHGHQLGWPIESTASFANALGAIVASRAGAIPVWTTSECMQLISSQGKTHISQDFNTGEKSLA